MKKLLFIFCALLVSTTTFAQLADGTTAPDFTVNDINGVSHHMHGYTAAGKKVIMDISATWCGPCWGFHHSGALKDIYYAYGPDGSDEVVVLFVEGDGNTTSADLNGTGTNTHGDWVTGTPYPIIDNSSIAVSYSVGYYPALYGICPTGNATYLLSTSSNNAYHTAAQVMAEYATKCSGGAVTGVANHARLTIPAKQKDVYICDTSSATSLSFQLKNYGNNTITSGTAVLKENGTVVSTKNFSGNIAALGTSDIAFDPVVLNASAVYSAELTGVNGSTPHTTTGDFAGQQYTLVTTQQGGSSNVTINVRTDNWPAEISWNIKDGNTGIVVASGGSYQGNGNNSGGADALTTKVHTAILSTDGCYNVEFLDSYGDGWYAGTSSHTPGIEVLSGGVSIYNENAGNFGSSFTRENAFRINTLSTDSFATNAFNVYPNPSNGTFNIETQAVFNIEVFDVAGKTVFTQNELNATSSINLSFLESGVYFAKVKSENAEQTIKLIIKK